MFRLSCIFYLLALPFWMCAQSDSLQLQVIYTVPGEPDLMETDNLHNLYLTFKGNVNKYGISGETCCTYSREPSFISSLDVSNPLRPSVFYQLQGQLVVLDNTLSPVTDALSLQRFFNQRMLTLAAQSTQNSFWFYDSMNFELIRCTDQFKIVAKTGNLPQLLNQKFEPVFMREYNNRLYVSNPETGILIFDLYGTYIKTIPIPGLDHFQIFDNLLVYSQNSKLRYLNLRLHSETLLDTGINNALEIQQQGEYLFVKRPNEVVVFRLVSGAAKP